MPFSVKSPRADALLAELRRVTGEGITDAVTQSLEFRLKNQYARSRPTAEDIMAIARELRGVLAMQPARDGQPTLSTTHGDLLYDADGLPR